MLTTIGWIVVGIVAGVIVTAMIAMGRKAPPLSFEAVLEHVMGMDAEARRKFMYYLVLKVYGKKAHIHSNPYSVHPRQGASS